MKRFLLSALAAITIGVTLSLLSACDFFQGIRYSFPANSFETETSDSVSENASSSKTSGLKDAGYYISK